MKRDITGTTAPKEMILAPVPPALRDAILGSEWYRDEVDLYNFAMGLHQRQLEFARSKRGASGQ